MFLIHTMFYLLQDGCAYINYTHVYILEPCGRGPGSRGGRCLLRPVDVGGREDACPGSPTKAGLLLKGLN